LFTFTYVVTNNSVEQVTITSVHDNVIGDITLPAVLTLAPGASSAPMTGTYTYTEAGIYGNTVTAKAVDNENNEATNTATASVTVVDVLPTVDLTKSVTPSSRIEPGGAFLFTLTIHNTSVEAVTITALTDDNPLPAGCTDLIGTTLAANNNTPGGLDEVSCTYSVTHTETGSYPNTASVTVKDNENNTASDSDSASVEVLATTSKIAPTQTTCQMYRDGTAEDYTTLLYNVSKGKIGSVSPGVIFFWSTITAPSASFSLEGHQFHSPDSVWKDMGNLDVFLWDANCDKVQTVTLTKAADGHPVLNVTGATAGATYYFSVKYDTGSITGIPVKKPYPTVNYTFETLLNGSLIITSPDSVAVVPKK